MGASATTNVVNGYTNSTTTNTGGTLTDAYTDNITYPFTAGTAANQIDTTWSHAATLSTSATTFTASALTGPGSGTTAFARVRKMWIHNLSTNETGTNTLVFAPGATHPWLAPFVSGGASTNCGVTIQPGGCLLLVGPLTTGFVVTASSSDQFTLTSVGAVPYTIEIEGSSV